MKPFALIAAAALLVAAGSSAAVIAKLPPAASAGQQTMYGHVRSLTRKGARFELRFDPAWWLTGVTASRAKLEDTGSSDVPNDYYIVEEGHRLLTYLVSPDAHVMVITRTGSGSIPATAITVSE